MAHPTRPPRSTSGAERESGKARGSAAPTRPMGVTWSLRQWMMDHLSIRQRLATWYASLLAITLILFSVIVYTVAQNQFQTSINNDLQSRAEAIAGVLSRQAAETLAQSQSTTSPSTPPTTPPSTAHATATASGQAPAQASVAPGGTPSGTASATATAGTLPTVTPNPQAQGKIQQVLLTVPDLLKRLDTQFEVIVPSSKGIAVDYPTPSPQTPELPTNSYVFDEGLLGVPGTYTTRFNSALVEIYVQPIFLPSGSQGSPTLTTGSPSAHTSAPSATATPASRRVVGLVLVAKPLDDMNASLATLAHLLIVGDLLAFLFVSLGGWFIAEGSLRPIAEVTRTAREIARNAEGRGLGTRVVHHGARDEVGELATTFNGMLDAIERSATAQRRFVADASHELRAPLMTIKGSLELLRRAPDLAEEEQRATISDAYTEAERMAALINDLLLLARADAAASGSYGLHEAWLDEQLRGRREVVELDRLAMDAFRHGRAQLEASRKTLRLSVTDLEPVSVLGDPGQLRQYALIVLDNAIKYTPVGGTIRITATREGDRARLSISDSGIGIDPADWPHIFERFYRADKARERDEHGSGLGLAIAKWIASAHRGEISVTSEPGKGSTFTLLLPALPRGTGQSEPRATAPARGHHEFSGRTAALQAVAPLARLARTVSRSGPRASRRPRTPGTSNGSSSVSGQNAISADTRPVGTPQSPASVGKRPTPGGPGASGSIARPTRGAAQRPATNANADGNARRGGSSPRRP